MTADATIDEGVTVCTLTRDRTSHLVNQVHGLRASHRAPAAHVVAVMGGEDPRPHVPATPWETRFVRVPTSRHELPLARARNVAARAADTEALVMLDVDCIPSPGLVGAYARALGRFDGIVMGEVRYLPPGDVDVAGLRDDPGRAHPSRPRPPAADVLRTTDDWHLFWSLSFGVRRSTLLDHLDGFDVGYVGYGAEDTDFALRAHRAGVPFAWLGGARAHHQYHPTFDPPVQHLASIVVNAHRFHDRWGRWPMEGWLRAFAARGLVDWDPQRGRLQVVRAPDEGDLASARQDTAVPR
ncbi:glycosyltransferase family 2 protein [Salsipaludibacter albus]|uniref:glycosyltransferase family 2 protein n=1 Tax=Salsipaludibacter albus TaxID=2849650 RepID=UPI001EE3F302|nr:glycosyl transferase [Salsipaludibacter albus]MBY5161334.1 glycosyltransferase [Salsipaludibacter albus]